MEPRDTPLNAATSFCAGLPMVAERSLTDAEREELQRAVRRSRRSAILALAGPWALLAVGIPLSIALANTTAGGVIAPLTGIGFVIGLVFSILIGRDHNKVVYALRLDLTTARVERYQGVLEPATFDTYNFQRLRKEGIDTNRADDLSFEVLKASGLLLSVNGNPCGKWESLTRNQVAAPPDDDYEDRLAPAPRMSDLPAGTELAMRDLSPEEIDEIRRYTRQLFRGKLVAAIGLALWAGLPPLLAGKPPPNPMWYPLCALAVYYLYAYARDVLLATKMRQDVNLPVTIVDVAAVARHEPGEPKRVEVLGSSHLQWRADGRPAQWRRLG